MEPPVRTRLSLGLSHLPFLPPCCSSLVLQDALSAVLCWAMSVPEHPTCAPSGSPPAWRVSPEAQAALGRALSGLWYLEELALSIISPPVDSREHSIEGCGQFSHTTPGPEAFEPHRPRSIPRALYPSLDVACRISNPTSQRVRGVTLCSQCWQAVWPGDERELWRVHKEVVLTWALKWK